MKLPETLLAAEVSAICQRYRIEPDSAQALLERHFAAQPDLVQKILACHPAEDVTRFGAYRQVIKAVKKEIYYQLRRYHRDQAQEQHLKQRLARLVSTSSGTEPLEPLIAELLSTHVSTQERFQYYETFYRTLFQLIEPPQNILDIGCGIQPLSYPFRPQIDSPERYVAIDKDPAAIELLALYAGQVKPAVLVPVRADLATVRWEDYLGAETACFDLTLMLKLVPVVQRRDAKLLPHLAAVPTRTMLITASAEAMTRRENIQRRQARALHQFIELTGRSVVSDFKVGYEFGYLLR